MGKVKGSEYFPNALYTGYRVQFVTHSESSLSGRLAADSHFKTSGLVPSLDVYVYEKQPNVYGCLVVCCMPTG